MDRSPNVPVAHMRSSPNIDRVIVVEGGPRCPVPHRVRHSGDATCQPSSCSRDTPGPPRVGGLLPSCWQRSPASALAPDGPIGPGAPAHGEAEPQRELSFRVDALCRGATEHARVRGVLRDSHSAMPARRSRHWPDRRGALVVQECPGKPARIPGRAFPIGRSTSSLGTKGGGHGPVRG